jgi:hypothetical protein
MILARIDQEEPHYAGQAARALREQGLTIDIGPSLQEDIDTKWTWDDHPMPWCTRTEIREVSDKAQTLHDDIVSGRPAINLHAHNGHTTVAVGTFRGGESVHLHGENHLRQVARIYDTPARPWPSSSASTATSSGGPGPAPATDTEPRAAKALATATTGAPDHSARHVARASPAEDGTVKPIPLTELDPCPALGYCAQLAGHRSPNTNGAGDRDSGARLW